MALNKEWSKYEVRQLIKMYEQRPLLWDLNLKDFKNTKKKNEAWLEIASWLQTTPNEVTKKIHNLRNQYSNELRKTYNTMHISKWNYFESLSFLKHSIVSRSRSRQSGPKRFKAESCEDDSSNTDTVAEEEIETKKLFPIIMEPLMDDNQQSQDNNMDEYEIFGRYVASEMRSLKTEHLRTKLKRQIQRLILEACEENDSYLNSTQLVDNIKTEIEIKQEVDSE